MQRAEHEGAVDAGTDLSAVDVATDLREEKPVAAFHSAVWGNAVLRSREIPLHLVFSPHSLEYSAKFREILIKIR